MNKYIKKKCYGQILFIYIFLGIIGCFLYFVFGAMVTS